ncbi:glucosamine-6-phosphate deaminase [Clostridium manihotivorum]|uniref:Glucosamine-6-phosphate deaminase n=1 Tax=Clostridium manihotivorum TaxID=2320868 RepID=A0A410DNY7_9CLOT|nr:glucosamine-6-phosphate deaminase [Clostridium manihotivorum]QAA30791.1 glucosamine-6-phosphate deaminase [Clostridium manihotivorum]
MKLIVTKDYEEMSKVAAKEISDFINSKPEAVLGLATGGTPKGLYEELIKLNKQEIVDFSNVTSINLDEYIGLSGEHEQSYRYFMDHNFFNYINIDKSKTFVPNGLADNIDLECIEYDKKIAELGGIDLQLLGIGSNGHIGFNEPAEYLYMGTHQTNLAKDTIEANSRFFKSIDEVPRKAITMGIGGIMKAKKIVLLASGENKAEVVKELVSGKITTEVPASMLQMHRDVVIVIDEAAAKFLSLHSGEYIKSSSGL